MLTSAHVFGAVGARIDGSNANATKAEHGKEGLPTACGSRLVLAPV